MPSIAIVGAGPRGLSMLERLAATSAGRDLTVHVIDPGPMGVGVHREEQHDELLLNTVAGQITMFRRGDPSAHGELIDGPSLAEWADVARDTYLPRRMLGAYLRDAYLRLRDGMPDSITIVEHVTTAVGIERLADDTWRLDLADGSSVAADFVVLATGHGTLTPSAADESGLAFAAAHRAENPALAYHRTCYPLEDLARIPPGARVGIRGMGLAAVDVVLTLTVGRGGHFAGTGRDLVYVPSGAEPQIAVWSRHGRAFWPRARNEKSPDDVHRPVVMDVERVRAMRELGRRDFAGDYVPLLVEEMRAAAAAVDDGAAIDPLAALLAAPHGRERGTALDREAALTAFFAADEQRAEAGNMTDPVKAATDAVRDLRNEIREAVEHRGLEPDSHRDFVEAYAPLLHVMSAGPPALRAREWRALLASGVLQLAPVGARLELDDAAACFRLVGAEGESSECDVVIGASVDPFLPERDSASLTANLLGSGHARPFRNGEYHPGGWDIDGHGRLIDGDGIVQPALCAIGNPTEGPHYFTNMLPSPGLPSRITEDAQRVVDAFEATLREGARPREGAVR